MTPDDRGQGEHPEREIHRVLRLVTPWQEGPDVAELQDSADKELDAFKLRGHLERDGVAGPHTFRIVARAYYAIGGTREDADDIRIHGRITRERQLELRQPEKRGDVFKERSKQHVEELRKRQEAHDQGASKAVEIAREYLGKTEQPAGTNRAPWLDPIVEFMGGTIGEYWCGDFAGFCVVKAGAKIPDPWRLRADWLIEADARAGQNGLTAISTPEIRAGDLIAYTFPHIELAVGPVSNGRLHTIGGNTSDDDSGSQNNGGGVYERTDRAVSLVQQAARPNWS